MRSASSETKTQNNVFPVMFCRSLAGWVSVVFRISYKQEELIVFNLWRTQRPARVRAGVESGGDRLVSYRL